MYLIGEPRIFLWFVRDADERRDVASGVLMAF